MEASRREWLYKMILGAHFSMNARVDRFSFLCSYLCTQTTVKKIGRVEFISLWPFRSLSIPLTTISYLMLERRQSASLRH